MPLPPVVERELRVAFRKQQPVKRRLSLAASAAVATVFFIVLGAIGGPSTKTLHWLLFVYGLLIALRALRLSASLFSEERRNQTLELLFLTGMTAPQLFITKLIGGLLIASSDLLAIMPFLSIPFLAGGLSLQLFVATVVTLPTLLLFTVSVGVLVSVVCHDDGTALLMGAVIVAVLCLLTPIPYNLGLALTNRPPFSSFWLCLSPAYAPWLISENFGSAFPANFWPAIGITLSWSLLGLAAAAATLGFNWRNDPKDSTQLWRRTWR
jgi:ABC-type transport system involved in cytochrome c biogenesis permease component